MRLVHPFVAALLAIPTIAMAQAPGSSQESATPPAAPSAEAAATPAVATVTAGMPVVDKDGKPIGKVAKIETDASGKAMATIKMGADSFAVNTSALAMDNGAAKLNFTKAQLSAHLKGR